MAAESPPSTIEARRYARIRYRLLVVDLLGSAAFLIAFQALGGSAWAAAWARRLASGAAWQLAVYAVIFGVISWLVFLPLRFYSGFVLEHRFGLSRMTLRAWMLREAKQLAVAAPLSLALLEGLYATLRWWPDGWVVIATVGWVGVSVILARVFPTWLVPLFYRTVPLDDASLAQRLLALCARARLSVLGVFRVNLGVETRKANAALAGLGRTRRVLISDTLLDRFTPEEIETVLAHELGHQRFHHITKFLVLGALGSLAAFWAVDRLSDWWIGWLGLRGLADPEGLPILMLALSVLGLFGLPIQNAISRQFEWQCDRFAVSLTKLPHAFASALQKLADQNLADPAPPRWVEWLFYDHPAITKRIAAASPAK